MTGMDATNHGRRESYGTNERSQYFSPYVEISSDSYNYESTETTSLLGGEGSVNSFLDEAEIISPSSEQNIVKAHDRMRKELKYFFMNPIQKWQVKARFPWKLCLQVIKILFATSQLIIFGLTSFKYIKQHLDMTTALSRLILKDWSVDVAVYPPSNGPYAVYTIPEFYDNINYAIKQFTKISADAIGPYSYDNPNGTLTPIVFCSTYYDGDVFPGNSTIAVHNLPVDRCEMIPPLYPAGSSLWDNFTMETFLKESNFTLNFKTLIKVHLHFRLRTIFIKSMTKLDVPECYRLKLQLTYDNSEHDGQVTISFDIRSKKVACNVHSKVETDSENMYYVLRQVLNSIVIVLCFLSAILCLRSLCGGYRIGRKSVNFFKYYYRKELPTWELIDFVDFWYVNIVVSDIMLIFGSLIKLQIEEHSADSSDYSKCSILLGTGNLLIWVGLLRYLGFFPKYNMLILTLKRSLPNVLRFTLCVIFLYLGFCFCGWIVLAPYHIKFRTLSRTSECLFAVMNGDDMFATFALIDANNSLIWWFSRLYLYIFLLLFVYVVISLFISVIMDTFETIKITYLYGSPPRTTVEHFLAAEPSSSEPPSPELDERKESSHWKKAWVWFKSRMYLTE